MATLAIIGVGLIGGSLGMRLREAGDIDHVVGCGRSADNLKIAADRGCIHDWTHDPLEAVADADIVVVATPVATVEAMFTTIGPALKPNAVVTDVSSVKGCIVDAAARALPRPQQFVPSHPIAGTENSGAAAADPHLFMGRRWIVTPTQDTAADAVARIVDMITVTGAHIDYMAPNLHDEIFAWVSHMPHMVSFAIGHALQQHNSDWFGYGGGGLRDFLRIAASDAKMWRDIFVGNRTQVLAALEAARSAIDNLAAVVDDPDALEATLRDISVTVRAAREDPPS